MFSFGLFSSLVPFIIMLIVSAFGVASHFLSKKHVNGNEIAQEKRISIEENIISDTNDHLALFSTPEYGYDSSAESRSSSHVVPEDNGQDLRPYLSAQDPPRAFLSCVLFSRPPPAA